MVAVSNVSEIAKRKLNTFVYETPKMRIKLSRRIIQFREAKAYLKSSNFLTIFYIY